MTSLVAVIAPGNMGAPVGGRLVAHGLKVLTSLKGRSAEFEARSKKSGLAPASDDRDRVGRFLPLDRAAGRRALAGAAVRAGADREQPQAGIRGMQRDQPAYGRAASPR